MSSGERIIFLQYHCFVWNNSFFAVLLFCAEQKFFFGAIVPRGTFFLRYHCFTRNIFCSIIVLFCETIVLFRCNCSTWNIFLRYHCFTRSISCSIIISHGTTLIRQYAQYFQQKLVKKGDFDILEYFVLKFCHLMV